MGRFFSTLPRNLIACFAGRMLAGHLLAIVLTALLVQSGFDWYYLSATRNQALLSWAFTSAPIGGLVPLVLPLSLLILGVWPRWSLFSNLGWAIAQAELIGSLISSTYKAFTGRVHPSFAAGPDFSHEFRFGFLRGGVFWGWPSSHTTIAFAMAFTVLTSLPRHRWAGVLAILYAFYIGIGVSMTIHWFSDFIAGMILGSMIGCVVGRNFFISP